MDIELAQALEENGFLKSLLYCTKRSCNNCGKVNCENFQRQRKDCCENWVSYKDYIKQLEAQIEKMKCCGNCKYIFCSTSSTIEKDEKILLHKWNIEKRAYCDCGNGEGEKYQLWEIKEK